MFVPGDRPDRFAKAVGSGADVVVLDLEDAVAVADKGAARTAVNEFLATGAEVVVRVNGTDSEWFAEDVAALVGARCAVMVPKAHDVPQLRAVAAGLAPGTPLIPLIETAAGVGAAAEICGVGTVVRAAFGSIDLGAELGVDPEVHEALLYARSAVVLGSAAAGCAAPLDGVTTDLLADGRLAEDVAHADRLGFGGKLCIHPSQVALVNERFSPSAAEMQWARRVVAEASDGRACVIDGKMVDRPVVARAVRMLARANG